MMALQNYDYFFIDTWEKAAGTAFVWAVIRPSADITRGRSSSFCCVAKLARSEHFAGKSQRTMCARDYPPVRETPSEPEMVRAAASVSSTK